jgi:hypothetical protein
MILEIADIRILPGKNAGFETAIAKGIGEVIGNAKGFQGFTVNRGTEKPQR